MPSCDQRATPPAALAALGTTAIFHSASPEAKTPKDPALTRVSRYELQAVSREILPDQRVARCLRWRQDQARPVDVWKSREHGKAHYKNLQTCGSVWHCPVCAAKISERRRAELVAAVAAHRASGGDVLLMTLTNSHDRGDLLPDLLARQAVALTKFRQRREGARLFDSVGAVGIVRALEVTHGGNGWHPHYHFLVFVTETLSARRLAVWRAQLADYWLRCCQAAGLPLPDLEHGVDVRGGQWAAQYASKWGLEEEMTKAHIKRGRGSSRTPFDLLRSARDEGDSAALMLFRDFALAFKGKQQLVWSRGLKARLAIEESTDEEIAASADDAADLLGQLEREDWVLVCQREWRARLLTVAEREGWPGVLEVLARLRLEDAARLCSTA